EMAPAPMIATPSLSATIRSSVWSGHRDGSEPVAELCAQVDDAVLLDGQRRGFHRRLTPAHLPRAGLGFAALNDRAQKLARFAIESHKVTHRMLVDLFLALVRLER